MWKFSITVKKPSHYYTHDSMWKRVEKIEHLRCNAVVQGRPTTYYDDMKDRYLNRLQTEPNRKVRLPVLDAAVGVNASILSLVWHGWFEFHWNMPWIARKFGKEIDSGYYIYHGWLGAHDDLCL